jgi:hypothetical protein
MVQQSNTNNFFRSRIKTNFILKLSTSRWDLQYYSWWLFYLKYFFMISKLCLNFSYFKIHFWSYGTDDQVLHWSFGSSVLKMWHPSLTQKSWHDTFSARSSLHSMQKKKARTHTQSTKFWKDDRPGEIKRVPSSLSEKRSKSGLDALAGFCTTVGHGDACMHAMQGTVAK